MGFGVGGILSGSGDPNPTRVPLGPSFATTPVISPGKFPIQLGDITFSSEETPERWNIGSSEQMMAVHNLPGGSIITNDFGIKPKNITWHGQFRGPNIDLRVSQINAYKTAAQELLLSFRNEQYYVRIKDFDPGYGGGYNEYSIELVVTRSTTGAFASAASGTSIDQIVSDLQNQATTASANIVSVDPGGVTWQSQFAALFALLATASPLVTTLTATSPAILAAASTLIASVQTYQATLDPTAQQVPDTITLAASIQAIYNAVQVGDSPTSMPILGGELFTIAATQYGDVSTVFDLGTVNDLVYPLLSPGVDAQLFLPSSLASS